MEHSIAERIKTCIASELFDRCAKGSSIVLRKELLKDPTATRDTCIEHFFEKNKIKQRLLPIVKSAMNSSLEFAEDNDEVRERAFGAFVASGGNYRATPTKKAALMANDSST